MKKTLAFGLLLLLAHARAAAWDGSPRLVAGVSTTPLLVAAAQDDAYGAFVAWQEPSQTISGSGTLRVLHLTADGDADPAWPAGGIVLGAEAPRSAVRLVPDGSGGAYAWWLSGGALRLTRVLANGAIASGWTSAGKVLGFLTGPEYRPWVQADGTGGLWLGWFQGARTQVATPTVRIAHLGANGAGAGGWPSSARAFPLSEADDEWVYSASFAVAADGGAWALIATGHVVDGAATAGEWRLARLTPAGTSDPALPPEGAVLAPFDATQVGLRVPRIELGAVIADDAGGVFAAIGTPAADGYGGWNATLALKRLLADGSLHAQQPTASYLNPWNESPDAWSSAYGAWSEFSNVFVRDAAGELYLGSAATYVHAGLVLSLIHLDASGAALGTVAGASGSGLAIHPTPGSGFVLATYDPMGPTHAVYDPTYAYAGLYETVSGMSYSDQTFSPYSMAYLGSDAAPLPDGGALLVWSHYSTPTGLWAVRVGANGSVLDAGPPLVASRGLRLVREGSLLRATWAPGAEGSLRLMDVAGRERAHVEVAAGTGDAILARPGELSPGVYFARLLRRDGTVERARAVVLP